MTELLDSRWSSLVVVVVVSVNDSELDFTATMMGDDEPPRQSTNRPRPPSKWGVCTVEASTMKIFFVVIDLGLFPSHFSHAIAAGFGDGVVVIRSWKIKVFRER